MEKTPQELFKERTKRVEDAIQLKVPDRVPFLPTFSFFPAKYAGISFEEAMYDYDKLAEVSKKAIIDFEADMYMNPFSQIALGPLMEVLDYKQIKWPGHGVALVAAAQKAGIKLVGPKVAFLISEWEHLGAVADILSKLEQAGVNVTAMQAIETGDWRYGAILWVKPRNISKAAQALGIS
ncbi:MAG: hypothetical protein GH159_00085 [Dehalococcoidia bacterium]|nr:hypothetical protein [Dehalococcoidia bacterium]